MDILRQRLNENVVKKTDDDPSLKIRRTRQEDEVNK